MDLAFTPEEEAFRQEVRTWVRAHLPQDTAHKVHNALRLTREDMQNWSKILGDRKSTRLNSSHMSESRMPSSA